MGREELRFADHDGPHDGCDAFGRHLHPEEWDAYWTALSEEQQMFLRQKARWEHMSLTAVAIEWGVPT